MRTRTQMRRPSAGIEKRRPASSLTVREAALRLGKSLSYVYRLNREHGPFRFILERRRIYIDAASFEDYMTNVQATEQSSVTAKKPENLNQPDTPPKPMEESPSKQLTKIVSTGPSPQEPAAPQTWSGQRELVIRPSRQAIVVVYVA